MSTLDVAPMRALVDPGNGASLRFFAMHRASSGRDPTRWVRRGVGLLGAVLLHALMFDAVLLGSAGRKHRLPSDQGLGATALASEQEPAGTLIFITAPAMAEPQETSLEELASRGLRQLNPLLVVAGPDAHVTAALDRLEDAEEETSPTAEATGDALGRAVLFGRYLGQIEARIERAWVRPRTPIGAEAFRCRVRIQQSRQGEVQEVTLQQCNGAVRWQVSLVRAIERASPLPAPPDPRVFADSVVLSFRAQPFNGDDLQQDYEPQPAVLAMAEARRDASLIAMPPAPAISPRYVADADAAHGDAEHLDAAVAAEYVEAQRVEADHLDAAYAEAEHVEVEHVDAEHIVAAHVEAEHIEAGQFDAEHVAAERAAIDSTVAKGLPR